MYCEILSFNTPLTKVLSHQPRGIIFSGGPSSIYDDNAPKAEQGWMKELTVPVLGICYGLQLMAHEMGG